MNDTPVPVSWTNVAGFRLSRHHLIDKASSSKLTSVVGDMAGAQAQVLSAGQTSIWTRVKDVTIQDVNSVLWKDHSLVRAWAMRRTMFLLPAQELALFVRGTYRRAMYPFNWALTRVGSQKELTKLLDRVLNVLDEPRTRAEVAEALGKSYKLRSKAGGGWGNKSHVTWVKVGSASLPVGFLFHVIGARDVICSGPSKGAETTYVRADKWIRNWKDVSVAQAEKELLVKYLRAFAPATLQDFALWAGMYVRDAKEIWTREIDNMVNVEVEGWKASILRSDLTQLQEANVEESIVRLLPNFDSYLLGHKSHRNIVGQENHKIIYRAQGWVSPVVLVNGRAQGTWSTTIEKGNNNLKVQVQPFTKLSTGIVSQIREEAEQLGQFLECSNVKTIISDV